VRSVLIATPCYGGNLHVGYFRTALNVLEACTQAGIEVNFLVTEGESLVSRARSNLLATYFRTGYDVLAFIDADIEMSGEDFVRLAQLDGVRGAAVACKTRDGSELLSCWKGGKPVRRAEMPQEPFSVDYLGSAVLFMDRTVLEALTRSYPDTRYEDPILGEGWHLFPDGVSDGFFYSEDYGFCRLCREQGIEIVCDPAVRVNHYGAACWSY